MTRVRAILLIALTAVILTVLAVLPNPQPYNHLRDLATMTVKDDDCFYNPSHPYANVSVEAHGTTADGTGVWGAYVYPNRIGTVVASSTSAALTAAVRLERSVCWARS